MYRYLACNRRPRFNANVAHLLLNVVNIAKNPNGLHAGHFILKRGASRCAGRVKENSVPSENLGLVEQTIQLCSQTPDQLCLVAKEEAARSRPIFIS